MPPKPRSFGARPASSASAVRAAWPARLPVGVRLANDQDLEVLEPDLPRLALVALHFPKWVDGRAYSQARMLRSRFRFAGEVRATGEVLADMAPLLERTGFVNLEFKPLFRSEMARGLFIEGIREGFNFGRLRAPRITSPA